MKSYICDVEWSHYCPTVDVSERFPELSYYTNPIYSDEKNDYSIRDDVFVGRANDIKSAMKMLDKHEKVLEVIPLSKSDNSCRFLLKTQYSHSATSVWLKTRCLPVGVVKDVAGRENGTFVSDDKKRLHEFYKGLREEGEARLKKMKKQKTSLADPYEIIKIFSLKNSNLLTRQLSEKQLEVYSHACRKGYYDWPRKITIEEIAKNFGLDESTAREHLRKAERKLMPLVDEIIGKRTQDSD